MSQLNMNTYPKYLKTGVELMAKNFRFGVKSEVNLPDGDTHVNDGRKVFSSTSCKNTLERVYFTVNKWLAIGIIAVFALILLSRISARLDKIAMIDAEIKSQKKTFSEQCLKTWTLQANFDKVFDSSYICYYAAQSLGMVRAVDGASVIQISAPQTRPVHSQGVMLSAGARGM
ncbi:MAG: hypothetical protein Q4E07_04880 [Eubacteriales bacterium]|nr:hypothetical protein [Eubacteriales bacterium]